MAEAERRVFFVPTGDRKGWDVVEATRTREGWDLRWPARMRVESVAEVPPEGEDWVEAHRPKRDPRPLVVPKAKPTPRVPPPIPPVPPARTMTRPPPPKAKARSEERPSVPRKAMPSLSHELEDLLLKAQRNQPVPAGMAQCPLCGTVIAPMKAKKVRTHDNPVTGTRCTASGRPWAEFGAPPKQE